MTEMTAPVQRVGVREDAMEEVAATTRPKSWLLTFGVFELDVDTDELRKEGRLIHLRHQPVRVLRLLLERAGALVSRKEITEALWPDDIDVDVEQGLNHCMREVREALGDRPDSPRFIQTLPRRGYRFLMEVRDGRDSRPPFEAQVMAAPPAAQKDPRSPDPEADPWLADGRFE